MATHNEARSPGGVVDASDLLQEWYSLTALDRDIIVLEVWCMNNKGKMLAIAIMLGTFIAVLIYTFMAAINRDPQLAFWLGVSIGVLLGLLIAVVRRLR